MSYGYGGRGYGYDYGQSYALNGYDFSSTQHDPRYMYNNRSEMPRQAEYAFGSSLMNQSG